MPKITYRVIKKDPKKKMTFKAGKATLKKGAGKGTYQMTVRVTTAAKGSFEKAYKDFALAFKVK